MTSRQVALVMILLLTTSTSSMGEGGVDFTGVKLRGVAFDAVLGGDVARISFLTKITFSDAVFGGGIFDCRSPSNLAGSCPGGHGTFVMTLGYRDVRGQVSSGTATVTFPDGTSCVFSGMMPFPAAAAPPYVAVSSPIPTFSGSYACTDGNGAPGKSGDFYTRGGAALHLPKCKGGVQDPVCVPF